MTTLGQKKKKPKKKNKKNQKSRKNLKSQSFFRCHVVLIVFFLLRGFKIVDVQNLFKKKVVSYANNTSQRILLKSNIISFQRHQSSSSYSATTSTQLSG